MPVRTKRDAFTTDLGNLTEKLMCRRVPELQRPIANGEEHLPAIRR